MRGEGKRNACNDAIVFSITRGSSGRPFFLGPATQAKLICKDETTMNCLAVK